MRIASIESHLVVPRASESEKAAVTVEEGLYILMDDSNEGIVFSGTAWWTPKREDGRWVNGTETVFGEGVAEGSGEVELLADGESLLLR